MSAACVYRWRHSWLDQRRSVYEGVDDEPGDILVQTNKQSKGVAERGKETNTYNFFFGAQADRSADPPNLPNRVCFFHEYYVSGVFFCELFQNIVLIFIMTYK